MYVLARRATAIAQRRAAEIGPARLVVAGDLPPCAVRTAHRQKIVARDDTSRSALKMIREPSPDQRGSDPAS